MKDLQHYLKNKLKNFTPTDRVVRDVVIAAVLSECDIELKNHEVRVSRDMVFITTNPVIKTEILLKRGHILRACSEQLLGKTVVRDIR